MRGHWTVLPAEPKALTLRLYDAKTGEWSLYWGTPETGLGLPPQVGHFDEHGVGDFFADDTFEGKPVIVRYRWLRQPARTARFEQAFSADHGTTWETNWTSDCIKAT